MQTLEFKAELRDHVAARATCLDHGAIAEPEQRQSDAHYPLLDGRLVRRERSDGPASWIYYHRKDGQSPAHANAAALDEAQAARRWGVGELAPWLTVTKRREHLRFDDLVVHLDRVDGLGRFLEIIVTIAPATDAEIARRRLDRLRTAVGPFLGEQVGCSYADLVAASLAPAEGEAA